MPPFSGILHTGKIISFLSNTQKQKQKTFIYI